MVDFKPPPVPDGDAPITIRTVNKNKDAREIRAMLTVLKPTVVIEVIAWKIDAIRRFSTGRDWIEGSERKKIKVAARLTQNVQCKMIFVVNVTC